MKSKPSLSWLFLGATVGLLAAAYGILRQDASVAPLPETAIARVNGSVISRDIYDRVLAQSSFAEEESTQAGATLIENLVNEELLLQRGIELGMAESDSAVRTAIIGSLVASVTAEADAANPTDEDLLTYLSDNAERFSYTARLGISAWQTDDEKVAQSFAESLRVSADSTPPPGVEQIPEIPATPQAIELFRESLGPGIAAAAANMPIGSNAVFARRGRWLIVRVNDKEMQAITDLDSVRNRVLLDYRRQLADDTLGSYIDNLRQRADVEVALP